MQECYTDIHSIINGNLIWTGDKTNFKKKTPSTDHRPHHTDHTRTMRTRTPRRSTVQIFKMPANQASAGNSNCTVSIIKNANTMRLLHISAPPLEKYTVRSLFASGDRPFWDNSENFRPNCVASPRCVLKRSENRTVSRPLEHGTLFWILGPSPRVPFLV